MKWFFVFVCLGLNLVSISAKEFRNINVEQGLSSHQAYTVVKDSVGFIWVLTRNGIDRFNGEHVKNYPLPSKAFTSDEKFRLTTDLNNNLWLYSTRGKVYTYDLAEDKFLLKFELKDHLQKSFWLYNLFFHKQNVILLGTTKGAYVFDIKTKEYKQIESYGNERVYSFFKFETDKVLLHFNNDLAIYDLKTEKTQHVCQVSKISIRGQVVNTAFYDIERKELWYGTNGGEVIIRNLKNNRFFSLKDRIGKFSDVPVRKITSISDSIVYIGTDGGGVFEINKKTKKLIAIYREDLDEVNSLRGNGVMDILPIDEDRLFVTTYTGGLNFLSSRNSVFRIIKHNSNKRNSLIHNVVTKILEDSDGDIWFATNNGVSCWMKSRDKWIHFMENQGNRANVFLALLETADKRILAGSFSLGIFEFNKHTGYIKRFSNLEKERGGRENENFVVDLYQDVRKRIWSVGTSGEIFIYNAKGKMLKDLSLARVKTIVKKDEDHLFLGSLNGLFTININTFEYAQEVLDKKRDTFIRISNLTHDVKDSVLWISTLGSGIYRWKYDMEKLEVITANDGLPSNDIYSTLIKDSKSLWGSSERGLFKLNRETGGIETFSMKDGLSDEAFYRGAKLYSRSGELYFGSYQGVTYFNPDEKTSIGGELRLFLESFQVSNRIVHAGEKDSPLISSIDQTKDLKLKYDQRSFSININNISLEKEVTVNYSWFLAGFDEEWTIPSSNNVANYTNVKPGKYLLRIRAIDDGNNKVLDSRNIHIVVQKAPWKSLYAQLLYTILLAGVILLIIKYMRTIDRKRLSEAKIKFFSTTAHDIRTPLTLTQAPLGDLQRSTNLTQKQRYLLDLSTSNLNKLAERVNCLLDFQKSDLGKTQLVLSERDIIDIIKSKVAYFSQVADNKGISLDFNYQGVEVLFEWIDKVKFDKIIENLLSNAIKYTPDKGWVQVDLSCTNATWHLSISDNGIGIPKEDQKNLFKSYFRGQNAVNSTVTGTGIGLLLVRNYVLLHSGDINFTSALGEGTTFDLKFSRGKKHFDEKATFIENLEDEKLEAPQELILEDEEGEEISKKLKLLIVEDNDNLRNYLDQAMQEFYVVKTASNGKDGLEQTEKFLPDIIISDVGMPIMDGITMTNHIKSKYELSHIPIVLLTAFSDKEDIISGLKSGADEYLTKPFDTAVLLARIDSIIKNRQKVRERFLSHTDEKLEKDLYSNKKDQEFIEKAMAFIEDNLMNTDLTKDFFAQEMCVSPSLLFQKIKALTGQSPSEFIKVIRLKKSIKYLQKGEYSIGEVANCVGFSDAKYFSTCFKKFYKKSPSAFFDE